MDQTRLARIRHLREHGSGLHDAKREQIEKKKLLADIEKLNFFSSTEDLRDLLRRIVERIG